MNSSSLATTSFLHIKTPSSSSSSSLAHFPSFKTHHHHHSNLRSTLRIVRAAASSDPTHNHHRPSIFSNLKSLTRTAIVIGVTASMACKLSLLPAKAETPATHAEQTLHEEEEAAEAAEQRHSLDSVESLKSLLQQKLDGGEDEAALGVLTRLVSAQPADTEWKFLQARLLGEMGRAGDARQVFEEILAANPLSFEALFENAILMDRCGEGEAVTERLREALGVAEEEHKEREARDVRLIMAQMQFLQKNVEAALKSYQELSEEEPSDFRPYFCRGMIYSLIGKNEEAKEQFAKYRELSPKKFEVEGYLRAPLSRMKAFGSNEN